ncbi:MAG: DUF86 domain-containing protein [Candidatus Eremiobacteraeota bacterium]|nr:DUF86 domain-containing protein [Candidatus Eremiobacteraeota bacterium]
MAKCIEQACTEPLELIVLYGSTARGQATAESDLDLALLPRNPLGGVRDLDRLTSRVCREMGRGDLDIAWLPNASWLLWQEIARDGQILFQSRPEAPARFRAEAALRVAEAFPWRYRDRRFVSRFLQGETFVNDSLVWRKLAMMAQYLGELQPVLALGQERFLSDPMVHHAAERLVELLVEASASINNEVAQAVAGIPPSDYYSSFFSMADSGWVERAVLERLADWARIRNALVHRYEDVALPELWDRLTASAPDCKSYLDQVQKSLD